MHQYFHTWGIRYHDLPVLFRPPRDSISPVSQKKKKSKKRIVSRIHAQCASVWVRVVMNLIDFQCSRFQFIYCEYIYLTKTPGFRTRAWAAVFLVSQQGVNPIRTDQYHVVLICSFVPLPRHDEMIGLRGFAPRILTRSCPS